MDSYCDGCNDWNPFAQRFFMDNIEPDCLSCQAIAHSLRHFYPPDGPRRRVTINRNTQTFPLVSIAGVDENDEPTSLIYYVKTEDDASVVRRLVGRFFLNLPLGRDIEAVPSGQRTLEQIRTWDTGCQRLHPKCQRKTPMLPSRVIDVRLVGGRCTLFESKGAHANYMTLSHCWGKLPILTTKRSNIDAHFRGISLEALPKTFQDAILITAQLGIRYLWIDSLCIVQDDTDDWARESAKMASIYNNSYLTLAATAAKDGSEGLFKARDADTYSYSVTSPSDPTESAVICCARGKGHDCFRGIDDASEEAMATALPLLTRAWVFQERLLSPRLLSFSSDELVWECHEATHCECGHVQDYRQIKVKQDGADSLGLAPPDRILFQEPIKDRHWWRLVGSYTVLNLTKKNDRLPAFSGIASTLVSPDNYLAGLRRTHLLGDLVWSTTENEAHGRPSYQAPSWSWASVMTQIRHPSSGRVGWDGDERVDFARVTGVFTTPSTADPFGRVSGGELRISGPYFEAEVLRKDESLLIGSGFGWHCLRVEIPALEPHLWPSELEVDTVQDAHDVADSSVTLLAILSHGGGDQIYFLVLAPHANVPGKVQRKGVTTLTPYIHGSGKTSRVPVKEILAHAKTGEFVIV